MTHEFKDIVASYLKAVEQNKQSVLVSVVDLEGSAYRRPGVRMLISEDGKMTGAISGGCVEKDVLKEATSVFKTGDPKMMLYDGRYRLGCEGGIYILIEIFNPPSQLISEFYKSIEDRRSLTASSYYSRELNSKDVLGTIIKVSGQEFSVNQNRSIESLKQAGKSIFDQVLPPMFQLVIFGGEFDAAKLCMQANFLGWQVVLVTTPFDGYTKANFPGSSKVLQATADQLPTDLIDENTAVVMMNHNYAKDLNYLMAIKDSRPIYLGWLGPVKRRNKLLDDLMDRNIELPDEFMEVIHGPAGLNLGAESAEEIALSICSEIISVQRKRDAGNLKYLAGEIHRPVSN